MIAEERDRLRPGAAITATTVERSVVNPINGQAEAERGKTISGLYSRLMLTNFSFTSSARVHQASLNCHGTKWPFSKSKGTTRYLPP